MIVVLVPGELPLFAEIVNGAVAVTALCWLGVVARACDVDALCEVESAGGRLWSTMVLLLLLLAMHERVRVFDRSDRDHGHCQRVKVQTAVQRVKLMPTFE